LIGAILKALFSRRGIPNEKATRENMLEHYNNLWKKQKKDNLEE